MNIIFKKIFLFAVFAIVWNRLDAQQKSAVLPLDLAFRT